MASKKKQLEGITLLSMNKDNNDDDMEDAEEEEEDVNRGKEQVDVADAEQAAEEDLAPNRLFSPVQEQQRVELKISKSVTLPIYSV